MADVHGLEREPLFAKLPASAEITRDFIDHVGGWPGLGTSYYIALLPLQLKRTDFFLDVGHGMGEHTVLAGLGMPGEITPVRHSLGLSAYPEEVACGRILSQVAYSHPNEFQHLVSHIDEAKPNLRAVLPLVASGRQDEMPEEVGFLKHVKQLGGTLPNVRFMETNLFHLPLDDDMVDKAALISVASYVEDHAKRRSMLKELMRVVKTGGLVNINSYGYDGVDGSMIVACEEFEEIAGRLGVKLRRHPEYYPHGLFLYTGDGSHKTEDKPVRQMVYEILEKPGRIPPGRIEF
ncbi:MAG: class I SAM-dependent methyltransferase [Candidatus Altiarchaeota archaeon]